MLRLLYSINSGNSEFFLVQSGILENANSDWVKRLSGFAKTTETNCDSLLFMASCSSQRLQVAIDLPHIHSFSRLRILGVDLVALTRHDCDISRA